MRKMRFGGDRVLCVAKVGERVLCVVVGSSRSLTATAPHRSSRYHELRAPSVACPTLIY
jgi:hypothetical protein